MKFCIKDLLEYTTGVAISLAAWKLVLIPWAIPMAFNFEARNPALMRWPEIALVVVASLTIETVCVFSAVMIILAWTCWLLGVPTKRGEHFNRQDVIEVTLWGLATPGWMFIFVWQEYLYPMFFVRSSRE